jgi:hypothetical protein
MNKYDDAYIQKFQKGEEMNEMVENYKKALEKVWNYITELKEFGNECKCKERKNNETSFDTIDYTGDAPSVSRWCLNCGGYRNE